MGKKEKKKSKKKQSMNTHEGEKWKAREAIAKSVEKKERKLETNRS
jgi:hypothetical protein